MFLGQYDFSLFETGNPPDEVFIEAGKRGELNKLLADFPKSGEWHCKNMMFDHVVPHIFNQLFGGGAAPSGWDLTSGTGAALAFINLAGSGFSSEPTYQEATSGGWADISISGVSYSVDATYGSKRFIEDQIETYSCAKDPNGREAVFFRNRWLWLPSQAVGSIYSAAVWCNHDGDSTQTQWYVTHGVAARVRLKDPSGNAIIINKLSTQALLIDYMLTLYSV